MKTPLWISFCMGVFIGFMAFLMLTVSFTMWANMDEKLITVTDMQGSLIYAGWLALASVSFLAAAYAWRRRLAIAGVPLMVVGFIGLFGVYAFFAEMSLTAG